MAAMEVYRKLRIAWSVGWSLVAVLLIVLWVRSYWRLDQLYVRPVPSRHVVLPSVLGGVTLDTSVYDGSRLCRHKSALVNEHLKKYWADTWGPHWSVRSGVGYFTDAGRWMLNISHWLLIAISAAIAACPWVPYSRRF